MAKNKIVDEKLKTAMKTWLEQKPSPKCSQNKESKKIQELKPSLILSKIPILTYKLFTLYLKTTC